MPCTAWVPEPRLREMEKKRNDRHADTDTEKLGSGGMGSQMGKA